MLLEGGFKLLSPCGDIQPSITSTITSCPCPLGAFVLGCQLDEPSWQNVTSSGLLDADRPCTQLGGAGLGLICELARGDPMHHLRFWELPWYHNFWRGWEKANVMTLAVFLGLEIKELSGTSKLSEEKPQLYHVHLLRNCCCSPLWEAVIST